MPFTIPNDVAGGTAKQHRQAMPYQADFDILAAASNLTGVVAGCAVSPHSPNNMSVDVSSGTIKSATVIQAVTAGNVVLTAADPSSPRIDLIAARPDGVVVRLTGTPGPAPRPPALPAGYVGLAFVDVDVSQGSVTLSDITAKGVIIAAGTGSGGPLVSLFDTRGMMEFWHLSDVGTGDLPAPGVYEERARWWSTNIQILGVAMTAGFGRGPIGGDVVADLGTGDPWATLWGATPANRPKIAAGTTATPAETVPDTAVIPANTSVRPSLVSRGAAPGSGGNYGQNVVLQMRYIPV